MLLLRIHVQEEQTQHVFHVLGSLEGLPAAWQQRIWEERSAEMGVSSTTSASLRSTAQIYGEDRSTMTHAHLLTA